MKKELIYSTLFLICTSVFGQLKVVETGNVGIGTNDPLGQLHVAGRIFLTGNGNVFRIVPDNPGTEIGSSTGHIDFWYSGVGWNKIVTLECEEVSDISLKKNVVDLVDPLDKLMQLHGVTYNFKNDTANNKSHIGFIAQEVREVLPEVVSMTRDSLLAVSYTSVVPLIVEAVKSQQLLIDSLKEQLKVIQRQVVGCCNLNCDSSSTSASSSRVIKKKSDLTTSYDALTQVTASKTKARLYQNNPNPFSAQTEIKADIPEQSKNSQIAFFNMQGEFKKVVSIQGTGRTVTTVDGYEFSPGMYIYSLIIDGKEVESKRMIILN